MSHRSAILEVERVSRPGRPDPGTACRPFRKSSGNMRFITTVGSRAGTGADAAAPGPAPRTAFPPGRARAITNGRPVKKTACGVVSLRRYCPDQVPGGRRSASELSPASQPFLPAPGLPGTPFGPAPSITSQTIFTLHGADDGRLGPKAPARTGRTSCLRRTLRQRSGPVPACRESIVYGHAIRLRMHPATSAASSTRSALGLVQAVVLAGQLMVVLDVTGAE